jgi:thioredoxin-like negative regulator of GroEL
VIAGPTYNYYYYNKVPQGEGLDEAQQELEEKPPAEPAPETNADRHFDQAVKAFDEGDYTTATQKFHEAMQASPEDIVLPFAYVQALFACGDYQKAAEGLRKALMAVSPEQEGVFYPRGLYAEDSILQQQIKQLNQDSEQNPANADLKLLLGYQLMGINKFDEAAGHLRHASLDEKNSQAATVLLNVLKKLEKGDTGSTESKPTASGIEPL